MAVTRLSESGVVEGSTVSDTGQREELADIAVDGDGRVVVGGSRVADDGSSTHLLARYTAAGVLDTTFSSDGWTSTDFDDRELRERERARAAGRGRIVSLDQTDPPGAGYWLAITQHDNEGTLDASFSEDGKQTTQVAGECCMLAGSVLALPDGRLLASGAGDTSGTCCCVTTARARSTLRSQVTGSRCRARTSERGRTSSPVATGPIWSQATPGRTPSGRRCPACSATARRMPASAPPASTRSTSDSRPGLPRSRCIPTAAP